MKKLPFYIVDVFAEKKYAGNQLAVFRGAGDLSGAEMQEITREMHFSESTFILSDVPRDGGFDVRIFTPNEEVPFAGHPTLGTAHIIRSELLGGAAERVILNLQVSQIPVTFSADGTSWMKQIQPLFGPQHPTETFAAMLGLEGADMDARFPVAEVSTGIPFFIVPLKNLAALKKAKVNREKYFDYIQNTHAKGILVFCPEAYEPGSHVGVRVFADHHGVPEDPATGSGNGCLAGYLVQQRYFGQDHIDIRSEQGYEIGRPSRLLLKASASEGQIDIFIGGKSFLVARGEFI
jgi:trans-2,3-dihydro-3-hydroxyanthranilate isomerase